MTVGMEDAELITEAMRVGQPAREVQFSGNSLQSREAGKRTVKAPVSGSQGTDESAVRKEQESLAGAP